MYKDTLSLIRYIGNRFRSGRADYSNVMEAKIIVLRYECIFKKKFSTTYIKH